MQKIEKTTSARLVKQENGYWYIVWYDKNASPSIRYREKFNLNRIKDIALRQSWADKILRFLNDSFLNGESPNVAEVEAAIKKSDVEHLELIKKNSFKSHVSEFIGLRKHLLADGTIKTLSNTMRLLAKYSQEVLRKDYPDYTDFDFIFPLKFQAFCFDAPRCHSSNYAAKRLDHIRQFLSDAVEQGKVGANPLWTSKKYHGKVVEVDDVALTLDEIERIYKVHLSGPVYEAVRDTFVFACLVGGLRFSDFSKIKASDFSEMTDAKGEKVKIIKIASTQKTNDKVIVPLHPWALEIVEKHGGKLPKCAVNQVFNRYIKTICEKAGLTEGVALRENVGGKTRTIEVKKYTAVSAHTARRTFATVAFSEWKIPTGVLMKITGHSTEAQFFKYIKLSKEYAALEMAGYMKK